MNTTKSNRIKRLALGATLTLVLGGGAAAALVPSFASAAVTPKVSDDPAGHLRHGADDLIAHSTMATPSATPTSDDPIGHDSADDSVRGSSRGSDDAVPEAAEARHGADDPAGHLRHGADDPAGHLRHGADDPAGHARHGSDDPVGHT
jgi:hypothetical protein